MRKPNKRQPSAEELLFLADVSRKLSSTLDYEKTLTTVSKVSIPYLADWCTVHVISSKSDIIRLRTAFADYKKAKIAREFETKYRTMAKNKHSGFFKKVLRTGKTSFVKKITAKWYEQATSDPARRVLLRTMNPTSHMLVPLKVRSNKIVGIISLARLDNSPSFDETDRVLADELAHRAAIALENARLFKEANLEIAERKKAEQALKDSERKFSIIFEKAAFAAMLTTLNAGKIVDVNEAWVEKFGYTKKEVIGKTIRQLKILPKPGILPGLQLKLKKDGHIRDVELELRSKSGQILVFILNCDLVNLDGDVFVLNTAQDVTERREIEKRRDEFIAMASHELKTPVTSIKAFIYVLEKHFGGANIEPEASKLFTGINKQMVRFNDLINDLLDLSRIQIGQVDMKRSKIPLDNLVDDTVFKLQAYYPSYKIVNLGKSKTVIYADKMRVEQVLGNLIINAVKYSGKSDKIVVRKTKKDGFAIVSIEDFGIGIDKKYQDRIFERFYKADDEESRTYPGMGVGLFICARILDMLGGKIWLKSRKGKGSTFYFSLPELAKDEPVKNWALGSGVKA